MAVTVQLIPAAIDPDLSGLAVMAAASFAKPEAIHGPRPAYWIASELTSRLRGYAEPANAGRSAFGVDAALGSLLAITSRAFGRMV
jgi:hypothetical protein